MMKARFVLSVFLILPALASASLPEKNLSLTNGTGIESETISFLVDLEKQDPQVKVTYDALNEDIQKEWQSTAALCGEDRCFQVLKTNETVEVDQSTDTVTRTVLLSV